MTDNTKSIILIFIVIILIIIYDKIRYHFLFKRKCKSCNMTFDSLYYSHCCKCKKVYLSYLSDSDGWGEHYEHCCDCNSEYYGNHICKI
jgi:hypothetical protein